MSRFGDLVRARRLEKEITLRKFAEMVGVSPTFISKMERGDFDPPGEKTIRLMAGVLDFDPDELLAEAGKCSTDLKEIIQDNPIELASFLRSARGLSAKDILELTRKAEKMKNK